MIFILNINLIFLLIINLINYKPKSNSKYKYVNKDNLYIDSPIYIF